MASRLVCGQPKVVAFLPNLRAVVRHFRAFSSYDEREVQSNVVDLDIAENPSGVPWPDAQLAPLNPSHPEFPMPGYTGFSSKIKPSKSVSQPPLPPKRESDLLTGLLPQDRHVAALEEFITGSNEIEAQNSESCVDGISTNAALDALECVAQECPRILRKDLQDMFPDRDLMVGPFTVLTISQQTQNNMALWNAQVEKEREDLLHNFILGAEEICNSLHAGGYWADFIDPSSGKPYMGAHTNTTLMETDERYRMLGFEIEDLGCCKVISHHIWGTNAYVGCLFTNAPLTHPVLAGFGKENNP
jgi:hypothetical protein